MTPESTTADVPSRSANRRHVAVVNPASGSALGDGILDDACARLGIAVVETTEDDPGTGQARVAVADGAAVVVACGGDGTVRAVLESVAGSDAELAVVPLGTGNLLAANLGIPNAADSLDEVLDLVEHGTTRRLDVGDANGETFAVMAGAGFDALMIRDASTSVKRRFGSIAYVISAIRNLPARLVPATVEVDGDVVHRGRAAMVLVGNCGTVSGGLEVFPDARPDDGVLDVAVLAAERLRDWCSVGWRLVRGTAQRPELVQRFRGRDVVVTLARPTPYELDGEDRPPTTRLHCTIRPGALAVRVPAGTSDSGTGSSRAGSSRDGSTGVSA